MAVAAVFAIALSIGAQKVPPNAAPATNTKSAGRVSELNGQQEAGELQQASPNEPQIAPCNQASPCYVIEQPEAKSEGQQAKDDSLDTLYRRYLWATIIGVVGAWFGLAVLICQTLITRKAANAAYVNAQAVLDAERAWILAETGTIPDDFEPNPTYLAFLEIRPVIGNYGKTPGRITRIGLRFHRLSNGEQLPSLPHFEQNQISETDILLPSGDVRIQPAKVLIPHADIASARSGQVTLYVYGFVEYKDLANKRRRSNCCFIYHIPQGFTSLGRGWYTPGGLPKAYTECT